MMMVKLNHIKLRSKMVEQHWTQEKLAEKLGVSDRHIRNLCTKDTDTKLSVCYKMSKLFETTMEDLLVVLDVEE